MDTWNGVALFPCLPVGPTLVSDVSGLWGCGVFCKSSGDWFQLQWPQHWESINIAVKELVPILISTAVWGSMWWGKTVIFLSDNQAAVMCLNSRTASDPLLVHLLRCLFFLKLTLNVNTSLIT